MARFIMILGSNLKTPQTLRRKKPKEEARKYYGKRS